MGVIHGLVLGDVDAWRAFHHREGLHTSKREWLQLMPSTVLSAINQEFDFHGPTMAVTAMCASGVAGLLTAKMWIDAGIADDVLVLTSDLSITPENGAGLRQGRRPVTSTARPSTSAGPSRRAAAASPPARPPSAWSSPAGPTVPTPPCSAGP